MKNCRKDINFLITTSVMHNGEINFPLNNSLAKVDGDGDNVGSLWYSS